MLIPIDSQYRITSDERQWTVQRYAGVDKKTGEDKWKPVGYFSRLDVAVNDLAQRQIRTGEAQTLVDALAHVENVVATLTRALAPQFDVKVKGE